MIIRHTDADRVRSIHLFGGISEQHFQRLLKAASLRNFPSRTVLFREGEPPTVLYTVTEGSVELFSERDEDGARRRCTVAVVRPIKPCVLTSIVERRHAASARTLERSQLLQVPVRVVHELIETDLGFASAATHELADDCREAIEHIKDHRLRTTIERVAHWMLRCDTDAGGSGQFTLPFDKRTLASYLGMAPENLSRNLAALVPAGLLVRGRRVTLNDRPALAARAGLSPYEARPDDRRRPRH